VIAVEGATAPDRLWAAQAFPALNAAVQGEGGDATDAHCLAAVLGPRARRVLGPAAISPGERAPGLGSAKPIPCDATQGAN
jgi:hypothetical protein